jgi:hypothetical protein
MPPRLIIAVSFSGLALAQSPPPLTNLPSLSNPHGHIRPATVRTLTPDHSLI